jgi:tRNA pseudouridine38-40 synthase
VVTDTEPAAPVEGAGGFVRLRIDLAYDGGDFAGWARQPGQRTVQEVLERAIATVLRLESVVASCAGRTDAGVHARGQVTHVDVPADRYPPSGPDLAARLAGVLPPDVRPLAVSLAPPGFDARFSALSRRYAFRISDAPYGVDPLRRHHVLWHRRALDLAAMNAAAELLLGEHDFAAFCRRREGATTVRSLQRLLWQREGDGLAVATVEADAFCHTMVRSLVGALLEVSDGRRPVDWPAALLAGRVRVPALHVVPAHGLTLEEVSYPPARQMAARAEAARRKRELSR